MYVHKFEWSTTGPFLAFFSPLYFMRIVSLYLTDMRTRIYYFIACWTNMQLYSRSAFRRVGYGDDNSVYYIPAVWLLSHATFIFTFRRDVLTATTLNNLGVFLKGQNRLYEAHGSYSEALDIRRSASRIVVDWGDAEMLGVYMSNYLDTSTPVVFTIFTIFTDSLFTAISSVLCVTFLTLSFIQFTALYTTSCHTILYHFTHFT